MATLSVLKFNDPYGADRVMVALQTLGVNCEVTTRASRRRPTGNDRAAH